ncbi:hypothetical protein GCM10020254_42980 [Streptomyces goshikiensis]
MCETDSVRENGKKIKVFLLDDHEVVRRGVHELLSVEDDIEIVGEAGTTADALVRIPATRPDVAVLDVRLPDGSGVEVCREVRSQDEDIKCLMLTSFADDEALFDAIMAGASGYVLKAIRGNELLNAVRDVAAGKSLLDPVATARVLERLRDGKNGKGDDRLANLTDQERKILDLIGEGLTNRVIGERLHRPRRPSRTTSPACCPNWGWSAAPRPPRTWPASRPRSADTGRFGTNVLDHRGVIPFPGGGRSPRVDRMFTEELHAIELLRRVPYGRVATSLRALPFLAPARHIVAGHAVVLRMHAGFGHHQACNGSVVSYGADNFNSGDARLWSVQFTGTARIVEPTTAEVALFRSGTAFRGRRGLRPRPPANRAAVRDRPHAGR